MNKEKLLFLYGLVFIGFYLSGCVSGEKAVLSKNEAYVINSKAKIKSNNESNTVSINTVVLPNRAIRMEISGTLGISVASILISQKVISYALHGSKEFVSGPFHEKTLYPVFKKNIDPVLIWNILQERQISKSQWRCSFNQTNQPVLCKGPEDSVVKFSYEQEFTKRIDIISDRFEMNWVFKPRLSFNGSQNETFVLKKPANYREIIIK